MACCLSSSSFPQAPQASRALLKGFKDLRFWGGAGLFLGCCYGIQIKLPKSVTNVVSRILKLRFSSFTASQFFEEVSGLKNPKLKRLLCKQVDYELGVVSHVKRIRVA